MLFIILFLLYLFCEGEEKFEGKVCVTSLQKTCSRLTIGDMYCHENESDKTLYSIDLLWLLAGRVRLLVFSKERFEKILNYICAL
jgi:hypothetical protein